MRHVVVQSIHPGRESAARSRGTGLRSDPSVVDKAPLKVVLLDQRVVAGLGNIYAAEALHVAGLSPMRAAGSVATAEGRPKESAFRLVAAVKAVLQRAISIQVSDLRRSARFRVYDRESLGCLRRGCTGTIARRTQSGRSTFYCPACQR